jgi:hypothetical protein
LLSIQRCREILGPIGHHLSDEEIDALRAQLATLADLTIEMFERRAEPMKSEEPRH